MQALLLSLIIAWSTLLSAGSATAANSGSEPPPPPPGYRDYYAEGLAAIGQEDWPGAVELLNRVIAQRPWHDDAHNLLGFAYRKQGDHEQSLQHYRQALELNPYHPGALEYLGEAMLETNQPEQARALLERLGTACRRINGATGITADDCPQWLRLKQAIERWDSHAGTSAAPWSASAADIDTSTHRLSAQGHFRAHYRSQPEPVPLNRMHSWVLTLQTAAGEALENAQIALAGGMPEHDHGLPSTPRVTAYPGNGEYRVEGLKFHMNGWWQIKFRVSADGVTDYITFDLMLFEQQVWSETERALLQSLWLGRLPGPPPDPGNAFADDARAAALGEQLFFDTRLSSNGKIACASCHQPERSFTDGLARARGIGETELGSMSLLGVAYSPWLFWDGRKDSLWSQALGPLENPLEHGGDRLQYACLLATDEPYRAQYQAIFAMLPRFLGRHCDSDGTTRTQQPALKAYQHEAVTRVFVNIGKAIAAYERTLLPTPTRFDRYVEALLQDDRAVMAKALSRDEIAGVELFIGKAQCVRCHNGPLFTNNEFHNTGVPQPRDLPPNNGRLDGVAELLDDEFNCFGLYSDAAPQDCAELRFIRTGAELTGAFKTPTLRHVALTAPYMHSGQFADLDQVLRHYNRAAPVEFGHNELEPLHLNERELAQLKAFLHSLGG